MSLLTVGNEYTSADLLEGSDMVFVAIDPIEGAFFHDAAFPDTLLAQVQSVEQISPYVTRIVVDVVDGRTFTITTASHERVEVRRDAPPIDPFEER